MDSLTQITLGAAMGEVVLGKKIGNRAMLWGAIGGTLPDFDVLANFFMDDMSALAFHRGITHSFLFAFTTPFLFGWLTYKFYQSGIYKNQYYKTFAFLIWSLLLLGVGLGINFIVYNIGGQLNVSVLIGVLIVSGLIIFALQRKYLAKPLATVDASWKDWTLLYFWAIVTHPILDSFTTFGTQLFYPFSDYRVAFNNISVVDPIYTVPFIICLVIAGFRPKESKTRALWTWAGIGISSLYMLFTVYHKSQVNTIFERTLAGKGLKYERYMTTPTILNNILWQAIAEGDTMYYHGMYSFYDERAIMEPFTELHKNHQLLAGHENDRAIKILDWFSNGYYNVIERDQGGLQLNDLRYGTTTGKFGNEKDYVFRFFLKEENGEMKAEQPSRAEESKGRSFDTFFKRMWGLKDEDYPAPAVQQ
ncbi:MAG: metal-dependent hydrolase [Saprospiraceae bacterium]|nr:metal-dependent hydrolase [Saprospiraceae bacterium]